MNTRILHPSAKILAVVMALACVPRAFGAEPATKPGGEAPVMLWPGEAPGEKGDIGEESNKTPKDKVIRITNVSRPSITLFRPPAEKANGTAVVVCPGGGYSILAWNLEGVDICEWLNSNGITAVLLKYRVPRRDGREKHEAPLEDVQRAMGLVRHHAKEWGIDPTKVGAIGFSAGGHLLATLGGNVDKRIYPPIDDADKESCRPDFTMLIYPFYLTPDEDLTKLSPEVRVTDRTPPTFVVMTQDDRVHYAYTYMLALKQAKIPAELHTYAKGGHGYGMRPDTGPVSSWPRRAEEWLKAGGFVK